MTTLIVDMIKTEINKDPILSQLMNLGNSGEIFNTTHSDLVWYEFSQYGLTLRAIPKLSGILEDKYISEYLRDQYRNLQIKDFVIISQEDIGPFMEPKYEYTAKAIKNGEEVESFTFLAKDFSADEAAINEKIKALATNQEISLERIFEFQEGDCGEEATVAWKV